MSTLKQKRKHKNKLGFIDPEVAGIDIGSKLIHVSIPTGDGEVVVREYGTQTPHLHRIAKDLRSAGVKTAVMEATGVYWVPLYEILEGEVYGIKPVLVDASAVKNVPGRKTDILDCQWIQVIYSAGLLRPAFRPKPDRIVLRSLCRIRKGVIKTRQRALLHMEKSLQLMNLKLSTALSDIAGITGMAIVRDIVSGERDPGKLAELRNPICKKSKEEFVEALTGNYQDDHLFALAIALAQYDFSSQQLKQCDTEILAELEKLPDVTNSPPPLREKDLKANGKYRSARLPPKNSYSFNVREVLWRKSGVDFTALPGVEENTALTIFAELGGANVDAWRSEKEFASWLKLCPGNNISGGKRRKSKHKPCVNPITQCLRLSAVSTKRSKTGLGAFVRRQCGKSDNLKGTKAGAHKIARILYQMCKHGQKYADRGEIHRESEYTSRLVKSTKRRAEQLGYAMVPLSELQKV